MHAYKSLILHTHTQNIPKPGAGSGHDLHARGADAAEAGGARLPLRLPGDGGGSADSGGRDLHPHAPPGREGVGWWTNGRPNRSRAHADRAFLPRPPPKKPQNTKTKHKPTPTGDPPHKSTHTNRLIPNLQPHHKNHTPTEHAANTLIPPTLTNTTPTTGDGPGRADVAAEERGADRGPPPAAAHHPEPGAAEVGGDVVYIYIYIC